MKLRRLNAEGIDRFSDHLNRLKSNPVEEPPRDLLSDPATSEPIDGAPEVEPRVFGSRLEAARYLDSLLSRVALPELDRDVGLWAWLTLFYFDQVCPPGKAGKRKVGEHSRYIPRVREARRFYRHLLLGPWIILRSHRDDPDRLAGLLSSDVHVATSETYRLFVENPTLLACKAVVSTATTLYFDEAHCRMKSGAGNKEKGGCRRLIQFVQQLDCTYDLPMLTEEQLLSMLPKEFDRFKSRRRVADSS